MMKNLPKIFIKFGGKGEPTREDVIFELQVGLGYVDCSRIISGPKERIMVGDEVGDFWETISSSKNLIEEGYTEYFITPQYKEVYVNDGSVERALENKNKRILIATLPGKNYYPYLCVCKDDEEDFKNGKNYDTECWKYIAEIPTEDTPKKMTVSEIEQELGYPVEIVK